MTGSFEGGLGYPNIASLSIWGEITVWVPAGGYPPHGIKLISKPSRRIYRSYKELSASRPSFLKGGYRTLILRTSKGIIDSTTALKFCLGGELLAKF